VAKLAAFRRLQTTFSSFMPLFLTNAVVYSSFRSSHSACSSRCSFLLRMVYLLDISHSIEIFSGIRGFTCMLPEVPVPIWSFPLIRTPSVQNFPGFVLVAPHVVTFVTPHRLCPSPLRSWTFFERFFSVTNGIS